MIVLLSNYYNHHQSALSEALYRLTNGEYRFIATEPIEEERLKMGWGGECAPFVLQYNVSPIECQSLVDNAEAVIIGSAPYEIVKQRILKNKLVFKYSERQLKKGLELWKYPYRFIKWHRMYPNNKNIHLLCASAYAARDYSMFGLFKKRAYKWGYFPKVKEYEDISKIIELKHPASILWVARLIELKHPEIPIQIAKRLKDEGYTFTLNMIGNGKMEDAISQMIEDFKLMDCVHMLGVMKPDEVRTYMEKSKIYLFTSDRNEGWGAVLNESMNSGCAVVANCAIGSVPYLLKHGENGLIYTDGDFEAIYSSIKRLMDNPDLCAQYGKEAYKTMLNEWNADEAAKRLLDLINEIVNGVKTNSFDNGPCSPER